MEKFRAVSSSPFFNTPDGPNPDAFISYSHKDLEFVEKLVEDCKREDLYIWLDKVDMPDYYNKIRKIENDIQNARLRHAELSQNLGWGQYRSEIFIIVLTSDSVKSEWVGVELGMAQFMERIIIPVLKTPCTLPVNETEIIRLPECIIKKRTSKKDSDQQEWFKLANYLLAEKSIAERRDIEQSEDFDVIPQGYFDFGHQSDYTRSKDSLVRYIKSMLG